MKESPRIQKSCMPEMKWREIQNLPKCTYCQKNGICDRGRPCLTCIEKKINCQYEDQEGMVTRVYPAPGATQRVQGFKDAPGGVHEECIRCWRSNLSCDGEQPCRRCVKDQEVHSLSACNYLTAEGVYERYNTKPYILDLGERILRPDYENYTGRSKVESRAKQGVQELRELKKRKENCSKSCAKCSTYLPCAAGV